MGTRLEKQLAIVLYGCFRQLEDWICGARRGGTGWQEFLQYYEGSRLAMIQHLVDRLSALNLRPRSIRGRDEFYTWGLSGTFHLLWNTLTGSLWTSCWFSGDELRFFAATLGRVKHLLDHRELLSENDMGFLVWDLSTCAGIIDVHMLGMPEIRKAHWIEHRWQSEFRSYRTIEEIVGVDNRQTAIAGSRRRTTGIRLERRFVLLLYCCLREADRSLAHALGNLPWWPYWPEFLQYYDVTKRKTIRFLIDRLHALGARTDCIPHRDDFHDALFVLRPLAWFANTLTRPVRTSWRFSEDELTFFAAALAVLERLFDDSALPRVWSLDDLRKDCLHAQFIMERRMVGVSELRKALHVVNYLQPDHISHVTIEEIVGPLGEIVQ